MNKAHARRNRDKVPNIARGCRSTWSEDDLRSIAHTLSKSYGDPRHYNKDDPVDELVFIMLSSKTGERAYVAAYGALKEAFPTWDAAMESSPGSIASVIRMAGLADKKERWIRGLLGEIKARDEEGAISLSSLRRMGEGEAETFLTSLPGVGLKSARCVLMYSLGRQVFPVDTHCQRALVRLGVVEKRRLTEAVQNEIQSLIPPDSRYRMHVNLVAHGRLICTAAKPKCIRCPISGVCPKCGVALAASS